MPGVSSRSAPPGSRTSSRWVVVWRPRRPRTASRALAASPSRRFTSVDLPTPDEPSSAIVGRAEVGVERLDALAGHR